MRQPYEIPRRRINALLAGFLVFSLAITWRVVSFQVVSRQALAQEAVAFRYREDVVPAQRGTIYDSRGRPLATNVPANRVSVIVNQVKAPHATALALAPLIGRGADDIESAITQPGKEWVVLQRRLTQEASDRITAMKLPGVVLDPEPRRVYPMGDFASQDLGFVNYDYVGSYGVEGAYNTVVGGVAGKLVGERDTSGNVIALAQSSLNPPQDGADLVLTVDSAVQRIVEQALDQALASQQASSGTIIVENPQTGEILAMASRPSFDPNNFQDVTDASLFNNPGISGTYEPGSTFKTLTMALGLETGVVTPDTVHDGGPYRIIPGGDKVYNALDVDFGPETMTQVLQHSSNLGAMWVAEQVGEDRFYRGLAAFGIGRPTGVDLAGEADGILPLPGSASWTEANLYTNAFGQGLAVTPLQLLNAECVLANGGNLMKPYLVKQIVGPNGTQNIQPRVVRRVISPQTSQTITAMLTTVMDTTYKRFSVPGYEIAAKTGTAQVPSPNGGYDPNATIGSMIGYGPTNNPQFAVLVKIDRPQESPWGESAAGPAFQQIFQQLFMLYGIPPTDPEAARTAP
ncbi:MAG TPA: penicillin-binding protein 2 [Thermomicrobiaceae bacterium]|nr:penicillin-binding protein 2 [Thermomicrobiaceae bacterium]